MSDKLPPCDHDECGLTVCSKPTPAGDPSTTGVTVYPETTDLRRELLAFAACQGDESMGDHIQARIKAEKKIATALASLNKDLDTLAMQLTSYRSDDGPMLWVITQNIGMLTDIKEILTRE